MMIQKRSEIWELEFWDVCFCCGKSIYSEIANGNHFNWLCLGTKIRSPCKNYKKRCNKKTCILKNNLKVQKNREIFRVFILNTFKDILNKYGFIYFANRKEIWNAIKPITKSLKIKKIKSINKDDDKVYLAYFKKKVS